jgi:hypothetical protein
MSLGVFGYIGADYTVSPNWIVARKDYSQREIIPMAMQPDPVDQVLTLWIR